MGSDVVSPASILAQIIRDPEATAAEKINAAKALDAIQRKDGLQTGRVSTLTLDEIDQEIARIRALMTEQVIEKTGTKRSHSKGKRGT